MITAITVLVALGFLGWGFYRARPFGKLGLVAWLQSVVLIAPWLLFFGLSIVGIYLNIVSVLFLFVLSTGLYIYLGSRLRSLAQSEVLAQRATAIAETQDTHSLEIGNDTANALNTTDAAKTQAEKLAEALAEPDIVPIPADDLKAIQSIFGIDTFFATETIPYQEGVILRGNLRGEAEATIARLSERLQEKVGFSETNPQQPRYRLFLVEGQDGKPVVIVLPTSRDPQPSTLFQKGVAVMLLFATIAASLESSGLMLGFDFFTSPNRIAEVLPLSAGLLSVLAVHELGHWLVARRYQVRLSLPFFIPTWQIGSFGAITRFESVLPNRSTLFDIAIAGPAAGGLLSLVMVVAGLLLSHKGSLFQVPTEFFQGSILVGTLTRVVLRESLQQPIVDVHPLVILGWLGLVITALNLLPAGQLDGGRIVQAIYGRTIAGRTTIASIIVLGFASIVNPLALYWAIVVLFLQRELERPSQNELTEPDDTRAALGLLALFLMIVTLLPLTPSLAGRLGIGG
ncbi:site-2 protease family protein [Stenomitos frigidus]|uniref:Site-2 protease family protein n=1 Tax=Stenomitos frigidus ULC18 TaxID=2107698 RepID=A0A2T1DW11_9CYAN|nr:site-2 protease family protein [Stenomitos frigidus]PSB24652.1 site-2 protease family protein [Stenomitos frigidus ULC18]